MDVTSGLKRRGTTQLVIKASMRDGMGMHMVHMAWLACISGKASLKLNDI